LAFTKEASLWGRATGRSAKGELAVLPSEIEQLPDLSGFLKIASTGWARHVRYSSI
jgi:hypothetical protein